MTSSTDTRAAPQARPVYPQASLAAVHLSYLGADLVSLDDHGAIWVGGHRLAGNGDTERERMETLRDAFLYGAELLDEALRAEQ